jgi:hypothetical protein
MEEEILKIIKNHFYNVDGTPEKSAKEITSHIMEFLEWLKSDCEGDHKEGEIKPIMV